MVAVASCAEVAGSREAECQCCRPVPVEPCLFLVLEPRGRYVMRHSWVEPRRRHCVQGAVPLHFFLLSRHKVHANYKKTSQFIKFDITHELHSPSAALWRWLSLTLGRGILLSTTRRRRNGSFWMACGRRGLLALSSDFHPSASATKTDNGDDRSVFLICDPACARTIITAMGYHHVISSLATSITTIM